MEEGNKCHDGQNFNILLQRGENLMVLSKVLPNTLQKVKCHMIAKIKAIPLTPKQRDKEDLFVCHVSEYEMWDDVKNNTIKLIPDANRNVRE